MVGSWKVASRALPLVARFARTALQLFGRTGISILSRLYTPKTVGRRQESAGLQDALEDFA